MNLRLFKLLYQNWWRGKPSNPPYNHVVQIGDPVLRQKAREVDVNQISSEYMAKLYRTLYQVMKKTGAVGMSAPQLGVSLRVFAIEFPTPSGYTSPVQYVHREMEPIPFQIWVNPLLQVLDYSKITFDEGCESMKGFIADIPRYKHVMLSGLDENGNSKTWEARGWSARIIQHEMDHLNGKFFTDIMNPESLSCCNWDQINRKEGRVYITFMPEK